MDGGTGRVEETTVKEIAEDLASQVDRLAAFIMKNVPGEPSRSEGAIDCAIRILGSCSFDATMDLTDDKRDLIVRALAALIQADDDTPMEVKDDAGNLLAEFGYGRDGRISE